MPISDYIRGLREKVGTDLLFMPGAAAVIRNEAGEILLQRRSDNGEWGLPGGALDPGEEPAEGVIREVREETGLVVIPERLSGVYGGQENVIEYPNGDRAAVLSMVFVCRVVGGNLQINDDESLELRYFAPDSLPALRERTQRRIADALRDDPRTMFRRNPRDE